MTKLPLCVAMLAFGVVAEAQAEPILQIYLEGGTYNSVTDSWELAPPGSSGGAPFRLWAIGNVDGPGGKGPISNVRLSAAYASVAGPDINISLTPSTTGDFGGFTDPSLPSDPVLLQTVIDGSTPILGDGGALPSHGIYGPGVDWQEFALGDFNLTDSPVGDFIDAIPTPVGQGFQINVYEVTVTNSGTHPTLVHFDLYDTIVAKNHAKFAPFSHDADGDVNIVPEPSSLALFALGAVGLVITERRRRKHKLVA